MEHQFITLVHTETLDVEFIRINDIIYIELTKERPICYLKDSRYYAKPASKQEVEALFTPELGFDSLDTDIFVNLTKIKKFDKRIGRVYFEECPNHESPFATVAKMKYPFVEKMIARTVSMNNDTQIEMSTEKGSSGFGKLLKRMSIFSQ